MTHLTPCSADADPTAGTLLDNLTLDLTALANRVCLAASLGRCADTELEASRVTTLAMWEELTGLDLPLAIDVARDIAKRHGGVTAAVVPF